MNKREKYTPFKKVIKTILNIISWTCLAILMLIAGCLLYYVASTKIYEARGEKYDPPFSLYTIISTSMEPTIKVYDVIVDGRVKDPNTLKAGDVITFTSASSLNPGMTVTHRIKEVVKENGKVKFRTQGDNNITPDSALTPAENILGKVLFKIPKLGMVQFLLASKGGWITLILIPALGIVIYDILKLFKLVGVKNKLDTVQKADEPKKDPEKERKEKLRKAKLKAKLKNKPLPEAALMVIPEPKEEEPVPIKPRETTTYDLIPTNPSFETYQTGIVLRTPKEPIPLKPFKEIEEKEEAILPISTPLETFELPKLVGEKEKIVEIEERKKPEENIEIKKKTPERSAPQNKNQKRSRNKKKKKRK